MSNELENHQLLKIPASEWPQLRELYTVDWPNHIAGYAVVNNFIKWQTIDPNIKDFTIYSLDGDWQDGTILITNRYQLFMYSLESTNVRLECALFLLDWTNGWKVSGFMAKHRPALLRVVESKKLNIEYDSHTCLYYFAREQAKNLDIEIPPEYVVKPLCESDANIIDNAWPNKHIGSLFLIKRLIRLNSNVGVYTKDCDNLIGWCLRLQAGALGALQVHANYFRKGLGSLTVKTMIKMIAGENEDTHAFVGVNNLPSRLMLERVGFKYIADSFWFRTYPLMPFSWIDP